MKNLLVYILIFVLAICGCAKDIPNQLMINKSPKTFLWLYPDSTIAQGNSKQHIHWWGEDQDGIVRGYIFTSGKFVITKTQPNPPDTIAWRWTTKNDSVVAFPLLVKQDTFQVVVRAVDNTFLDPIDSLEQALIRFSPFPYWDRNENGIFDGNDRRLNFPTNSIDPMGGTLGFPVLNQPPSVVFSFNPFNPSVTMQQPETTFTASTFAWVGSDPDGDNTIAEYRIVLNNSNDSTKWVRLPANTITMPGNVFGLQGNISLITLFVPRSRSDTATGIVSADIYSGTFLKRQKIGTLSGLKLDSLNTLYVQARDIAGDFSPIIQMPEQGKRWYVRKPKSSLLAVIDYIMQDSTTAKNIYQSAFSQITLPSGSLVNYDEINIGRGISTSDKQKAAAGETNPRFGALVPPFIDPAFIYNLFLFKYVFWYTDEYPSIPVAQLTLFPYLNTVFDGHKGKVIFTTSFATYPDPRGLLRDFAPIDSVSTVDLSSFDVRLPRFGDSRIPGGYQLLADTSDLSYPSLKFNVDRLIHAVYLRTIYRRADARYLYHIQADTRNPIRYAYTTTLSELKSISAIGNSATACGAGGIILNSLDGGENWIAMKSGVTNNLNSIKFLDALNGWVVGDDGTILQTNDGGISWNNHSLPTFEDFLNVDFYSGSFGVIVGTKGIVVRTTDGGNTWDTRINSKTNKTLHSVHFIDANNGIAVGDSCVIKSTDGGATWRLITNVLQRPFNSVRYFNSSTVFAVSSAPYVGGNGIIVRSTDSGNTWAQTSSLKVDFRSLYFLDNLHGWICGNKSDIFDRAGVVYQTIDGGVSWNPTSVSGTGVTQRLNSVAYLSQTQGWCVGTGAIIIKTSDGGVSWAAQPKGDINVGVIDGSKTFVFLSLPLHLLNGDGSNVKLFLEHIFLQEFYP